MKGIAMQEPEYDFDHDSDVVPMLLHLGLERARIEANDNDTELIDEVL